MEKYVLDSFAIIEYLEGSRLGEKVREIVEDEQTEILVSAISISEVLSKVLREKMNASETKKIIFSLGRIIDVTSEIAEVAARIHSEMKRNMKDFGLADAIILATSRMNNAKLISGDKHFKGTKDVIYLENS